MTLLQLGKKAATYDKRDLRLEDYVDLATVIPKVPATFGQEKHVGEWGMLGNDRYGDCVWAGAAHETMLWGSASGHDIAFTTPGVLSDYASTGFNPKTGAGDNGTDVRQALNYRRKTGIIDASGKRHKIGAYIALEPGNHQHVLAAMYLFGAVGIGIEFPQSAMDQFNAAKKWSVVHGASIEGGHYIPLVARRSGNWDCVTWAKEQAMTGSFFAKYCDEAYAILSTDWLNATGQSPAGFNLTQLQADLSGLG